MAVPNFMIKFAIKRALRYLEKDPETNMPKLMNLVDKMSMGGFESQRKVFRSVLDHPESNWYQLILKVWKDIDPGVRNVFFENFILNANIIGWRTQDEYREKYNCNIPWALLMDPTSACNLHCTGCWAAEYGNKLNLTLEEMDGIIRQGKQMGTYMYIYTGGEPLVRKKDIIALCEKHSDCMFLSFTNGTLIDEAFANEMLRVKNFIPAISVEGFEEATDGRRGNGTYGKVVKAMELLKRKKLLFGISCCYTSANTDVIGSEAYFDQMVEWGALFVWLFTYMPIGHDAVPALLTTAEQREFMYHQVRGFRKTKPIFAMDFWNDGEFVGGCIAGGRRYLHINANGDIDPCVFAHYSDSNIREKTLLEAYQSPIFMAYHDNQPFNDNHLRPCPILDNPGRLTKMVDDSGAHSTDLEQPETAEEYSNRCVDVAAKWAPVAERLWEQSQSEQAAK